MGKIHLQDMEFYAYHGCFKEEAIVGNRFIVNLWLDTDMQRASQTDDLNDALNYQQAYFVVRDQMEVPSHLLEHVGNRILTALFEVFPQLSTATVTVAKLNPPIGGRMANVNVTLSRTRN